MSGRLFTRQARGSVRPPGDESPGYKAAPHEWGWLL
jgi:hypothetical protein